MREIKQAVILAGGRGERLKPLTNYLPKALVKINKVPFLDYLLKELVENRIEKILFLVGYKSKLIEKRYNKIKSLKTQFSYSHPKVDTGKRLLNAYKMLDKNFILLYCDNYWPISIDRMIRNFNLKKKALISTTVFNNKFGTGEYGFENNVKINKDGYVEKYDKHRNDKDLNGVDIGFFIVKKQCLKFIEVNKNLSFENDILQYYINKNKISSYLTNKQYYSITNINSVKKFEKFVLYKKIKPLPNSYLL